jgi:Protein of unknown function (DUF559)
VGVTTQERRGCREKVSGRRCARTRANSATHHGRCRAEHLGQVPFGQCIVGFVCHDARLIVEIDGGQHESLEGIAQCERIVAVPGRGFAELGPGDLGLVFGRHEGAARALSAGDVAGARARLCRLPPASRGVSRNLHAADHRRQARRRGARRRRPPRADGANRPHPSAPHNPGVRPPRRTRAFRGQPRSLTNRDDCGMQLL